MKVCLLTEGSYPYVVGGVSSWTQMLIEGLPDIEFVIYSVGAESKDRGHFKYKLPENCTGVQEVFLDEILALPSRGMRENVLTKAQRETLYELVLGDNPIDLAALIDIFRQKKWKSPLDIFMALCSTASGPLLSVPWTGEAEPSARVSPSMRPSPAASMIS